MMQHKHFFVPEKAVVQRLLLSHPQAVAPAVQQIHTLHAHVPVATTIKSETATIPSQRSILVANRELDTAGYLSVGHMAQCVAHAEVTKT
jgi:hypothetical protein